MMLGKDGGGGHTATAAEVEHRITVVEQRR